MDTDFERRLSEVLQATTPEPPTAYRFASPANPGQLPPADTLHLVADAGAPAPRRRRWAPLLAAAAVVAIGSGVAAAALLTYDDHTPSGATATPTRTRATTDPACSNNNLLLSQSGTHLSRSGLTTGITIANTGRVACSLTPLAVLAVQPSTRAAKESAPPTPLSVSGPQPRRLAPGTAVSYTLRFSVARSCPAPVTGSSSVVVELRDGFSYSFPLTGAVCPVALTSATAALVRSR